MENNDIVKHYTNGEITVVWKPALCIHSKVCWQAAIGLPEVFNPKVRPWVKMDGSTTSRIAEQVQKCPSGALSFLQNTEQTDTAETSTNTTAPDILPARTRVEVLKGGPLMVYGPVSVKDVTGRLTEKEGATAFCRCGQSGNRPYCDGSHMKAGFKE